MEATDGSKKKVPSFSSVFKRWKTKNKEEEKTNSLSNKQSIEVRSSSLRSSDVSKKENTESFAEMLERKQGELKDQANLETTLSDQFLKKVGFKVEDKPVELDNSLVHPMNFPSLKHLNSFAINADRKPSMAQIKKRIEDQFPPEQQNTIRLKQSKEYSKSSRSLSISLSEEKKENPNTIQKSNSVESKMNEPFPVHPQFQKARLDYKKKFSIDPFSERNLHFQWKIFIDYLYLDQNETNETLQCRVYFFQEVQDWKLKYLTRKFGDGEYSKKGQLFKTRVDPFYLVSTGFLIYQKYLDSPSKSYLYLFDNKKQEDNKILIKYPNLKVEQCKRRLKRIFSDYKQLWNPSEADPDKQESRVCKFELDALPFISHHFSLLQMWIESNLSWHFVPYTQSSRFNLLSQVIYFY